MLRIALTVLLLITVTISPAAAQQYPERPLTILTGYPAGGMIDIVARASRRHDEEVPEGRGGRDAGGSLAVAELVLAKPDGYTIILAPYKGPDDYEPFINVVSSL